MSGLQVVTRPDLIERFERLNLVMGRFLPANGLPTYLVAQMRFGKYGSVQSQPYMQRLEEALASEEKRRASSQVVVEPDAPPQLTMRTRTRSSSGEASSHVQEELGNACEKARTPKELSELGSKIGAMAARGEIPIALMRALHENISRREQLLGDEREAEERAKAGEETIVRIVYVNTWTGGPLPAGTP